ncbi:hypothetical protein KCP73_07335 [Salmonella enterica subsp. enterica]|nr:hypothetical protein KCP73_07335 [Salmonella enterica subsp. enterica]
MSKSIEIVPPRTCPACPDPAFVQPDAKATVRRLFAFFTGSVAIRKVLSPDRSAVIYLRPAAADVQRCRNFRDNLAVSASCLFGDVLQNMKNAVDAESYSVSGWRRFEMDIGGAFRAIAERNV